MKRHISTSLSEFNPNRERIRSALRMDCNTTVDMNVSFDKINDLIEMQLNAKLNLLSGSNVSYHMIYFVTKHFMLNLSNLNFRNEKIFSKKPYSAFFKNHSEFDFVRTQLLKFHRKHFLLERSFVVAYILNLLKKMDASYRANDNDMTMSNPFVFIPMYYSMLSDESLIRFAHSYVDVWNRILNAYGVGLDHFCPEKPIMDTNTIRVYRNVRYASTIFDFLHDRIDDENLELSLLLFAIFDKDVILSYISSRIEKLTNAIPKVLL